MNDQRQSEQKINKKNKFVNNTLTFLFINVVPKASSIILIPLYTNMLTTSEYGISDLIITASTLLVTTCTLSISDAVFRYLIVKKSEKNSVLTTGMVVTAISSALVAVALCIFQHYEPYQIKKEHLMYVWLLFLLMSINRLEIYFHKGNDKMKVIRNGTILKSLSQLVFAVLFIVIAKWGLGGFLLSITLSLLVTDIWMVFDGRLYKYLCFSRYDKELTKRMIAYSAPLVLSGMAWWVNNASDRFILMSLKGSDDVGIYAISSKIPNIVDSIYFGIINAFQISTISDVVDKDHDGFWKETYNKTSLFVLFICIGLMFMNNLIAKVLYAKDFYEGWKYVPILLCAIYFKTTGDMCLAVTMREKKTTIHALIISIAAVANVIGNIVLIPRFSVYGAAIATMISFFVMWLLSYKHANKYFDKRPEIISNMILISFVIIETILASFGDRFMIVQLCLIVLLVIYNYRDILGFISYSNEFISARIRKKKR